MRVIGGTYRSRRLTAPTGVATRPTSDRLRETLFNVLAARVEGAVFADLYAGSGAVGIEALSRGAESVDFVEQATPAVAVIRANLRGLRIQSGFRIFHASVLATLPRLSGVNILFLDPPYASEDEYDRTLAYVGQHADGLLASDAVVIAEHDRKADLRESYGVLRRNRVLPQGDASLSFYEQHVVQTEA
jgi:16S rRNA (guanine966-N2)-methyltransferase